MPDVFDLYAQQHGKQPDVFDLAAPDPVAPTIGPAAKAPERGSSFMDIPKNAWQDIADLGPAMRTTASVFAGRMYEGLTPMGGFKPLIRPFPLSANEPSDIQSIGNIGMEIGKQYKQNYWDPMVQGRATDIPKYWAQHPVTGFMSDALMFVPGLDAAGVTGAAAKGVSNAGKALKPGLATATNAAVKAVEAGADSQNAIVRGAAALGQKAIGERAKGPMMSPFQSILKTEGADFMQALKPLYAKIPNNLKSSKEALGGVSDVQAYAEGWHPNLMAGQPMPAEVQAYLAKAEEFNTVMRDRLSQIKDPASMDQERWMPMVRRLHADKYARIEDIPAQEVPQLLADTQAKAKQLGIEPVYSPWLQPGTVAAHNANPAWDLGAKMGDIRGAATAKKGSGKNLNPNHLDNLKVRWDEIGQFFHAKKTLLEQMIDATQNLSPELQQGLLDGTHATYDLTALKEQVVRLAVPNATADEIKVAMQSVPDKVVLPKPEMMALESLANDKPLLSGSLVSLSQAAASLQKRYLLGGNPFYPETQLGQNIFVLSMLQFNGLRDTMTTLAAWGLTMANKTAREIVPFAIKGDPDFGQAGFKAIQEGLGLAQNNVPGLRLAGRITAGIGRGIETAIDANQWRMATYDAVTRMMASNKLALELAYKDKKLGEMLRDVASVSRALVNMRAVYNDVSQMEKVAKTVIDQLGDFSSAANNGKFMKLARQVFLWPTYFSYITKLAAKFPFQHPYKNMLLTRVQEANRVLYNDQRLPDYLQDAGTYLLPGQQTDQGQAVGINGGNLHPFGPVPELMKLYLDLSDSSGQSSVLGMTTPLANFGLIFATKKNPLTNRDFTDPRLVQSGREQYKPADVAKTFGQMQTDQPQDELKAQHPIPNPWEMLARSTFSYYTRGAETIFELMKSGGARSAFTSPLSNESAPRMTGPLKDTPLHPTPYAVPDALLNYKTMPVDLEREAIQRAKQPQYNAQIIKDAIKQGKLKQN